MKNIHCNLSNTELSEKEWIEIENRMKDRKFSSCQFLSEDASLKNLIESDEKMLSEFGITFCQIADRLETIIGKYRRLKSLESDELVEDRFLVQHDSYRGAQICPFKNKLLDKKYRGWEYGATDFTITDCKTGQKIFFNDLHIHMARAHHFLESPKCYRLNPLVIIKMFNLQPGISYQPFYKKYYVWKSSDNLNFYLKNSLNAIRKLSLNEYVFDDTIALLYPTADLLALNNGKYTNAINQIYTQGIEQNWPWCEIRRKIYSLFDTKQTVSPLLSKHVLNSKLIEEKIEIEKQIIDNYKQTGCLDNLILCVFSNKEFTTVIEDANIDINKGTTYYYLKEYQHVES